MANSIFPVSSLKVSAGLLEDFSFFGLNLPRPVDSLSLRVLRYYSSIGRLGPEKRSTAKMATNTEEEMHSASDKGRFAPAFTGKMSDYTAWRTKVELWIYHTRPVPQE